MKVLLFRGAEPHSSSGSQWGLQGLSTSEHPFENETLRAHFPRTVLSGTKQGTKGKEGLVVKAKGGKLRDTGSVCGPATDPLWHIYTASRNQQQRVPKQRSKDLGLRYSIKNCCVDVQGQVACRPRL